MKKLMLALALTVMTNISGVAYAAVASHMPAQVVSHETKTNVGETLSTKTQITITAVFLTFITIGIVVWIKNDD
jgi:formate/nitrite transporter FocA (FNT family)